MSRFRAKLIVWWAAVCLAAVVCAGSASAGDRKIEPFEPEDPEIKAALAAADEWLSYLDRGRYGVAWRSAGRTLQTDISGDAFISTMRNIHAGYGRLVERTPVGAVVTDQLRGAPDRHYVVIRYVADYRMKKGVKEAVALTRGAEDEWKVARYLAL
jgi:hypothetical protein